MLFLQAFRSWDDFNLFQSVFFITQAQPEVLTNPRNALQEPPRVCLLCVFHHLPKAWGICQTTSWWNLRLDPVDILCLYIWKRCGCVTPGKYPWHILPPKKMRKSSTIPSFACWVEPLELACGVLNQLLCCPKTTAQLQQLQLLHPLASKQPLSFYFLGCAWVSDHCWSRTGSGSAGCNCQSHNLAQRSGRQQSKDMVSGCREGQLLSLFQPTLGASYPTLPGSRAIQITAR